MIGQYVNYGQSLNLTPAIIPCSVVSFSASESVGEGHPGQGLRHDFRRRPRRLSPPGSTSRVACETFAKSNTVIVGGEITIPNLAQGTPLESVVPIDQIVRNAVREIGYVNDDDVFHADKIGIQNIITRQSPDIAPGSERALRPKAKAMLNRGAGDQGLMFGFACDETPGIDAGADHVCASAGARIDAHSQERQGPLATAGCEVASLGHL